MNKILLIFGLSVFLFSNRVLAQTPLSTIGQNRIIQQYHSKERLLKIQASDPNRLQALWDYFTESYTFSGEQSDMTLDRLMNQLHFDVYKVESLRLPNTDVEYVFKGVHIILKSSESIYPLLHGYAPSELAREIPARPIPLWTSTTCTENDFATYKEHVWEWAKDFPTEYLALTSNSLIPHIRFQDFSHMTLEKRNQLFNQYPTYLIVD